MKITILGSGAWGTALAQMLCLNGHGVTLWNRSALRTERMAKTRTNLRLDGIVLHPEMSFSADIACATSSDMVVFAVPSFAIRQTAALVKPFLKQDAVLVSVTKGIEPETTFTMTQVIQEVIGRPAAALSGPSHAEEVSRGVPTGCVAACDNMAVAELIQDVFMNESFRVYANCDVIGVELSAALKNVIALCAGISDGLGLGDNTKALLVTRGLTELARLGVLMGGKSETFAGLAGVGDMIVTCTSMHSRNRQAGILIGKGYSIEAAMEKVGAVVEGYYAAKSAYQLAGKVGAEMPIISEAYAVLYEGKSPADTIKSLMRRDRKYEFEDAGWSK